MFDIFTNEEETMKNLNKLKTGLLTTAAIGGLVFAAATSQAATVKFAPGASTAADEAPYFAGAADPDIAQDVTVMDWKAYNKTFTSNNWSIVIKDDDTFTEEFAFKMLGVNGSSADSDFYSDGSSTGNNAANTYVTMYVKVSGTVNDHNAAVDNLQFNYTAGTFEMFFHPDGDATDDNTDPRQDGIKFAEFSPVSGTGSHVAASTPDRWDLNWNAEASFINGTTLTDENGTPLNLSATQLSITNQQVRLPDDDPQTALLEGDFNPTDGQGDRVLTVGFLAAGTTVFENVPEPGTLALFGIGLLGMGIAARRNQKKAA